MVIIKGKIFSPEHIIDILRAAGEDIPESGTIPDIAIAAQTPSGIIKAYCAGDIMYPGIAVDLVRTEEKVEYPLTWSEWYPGNVDAVYNAEDMRKLGDEDGTIRSYVWQDCSEEEFNLNIPDIIARNRENPPYQNGVVPLIHTGYREKE